MEHTERKHALLSASSAHRWLACTPSARLEEHLPDSTSEAAAEGTLAHELAEAKVRRYADSVNYSRQKYSRAVNKLKKDAAWQDEMERYTEDYLDYIKACALGFKLVPTVRIEERVFFKKYTYEDPENEIEGSGIADCILIGGGTIQVIDFKYGQSPNGRVSAERNPQLSLYALGAYEACKMLYPVERIKLSIVQPRLPDGISEWECSLQELLEFGGYVKARADLAWTGAGEFAPDDKTCRFCRARAQCRAWSDYNVRHAFQIGELPPLISREEAGRRLLELESVARYQKDLQDWALSECLAGKDVPGWKAVEGRGSRDWTDMEAAFETLEKNGVAEAVLYERKPLTLAQVEKVVGKKEFAEMVGSLVVKNPGKPALVKESDKRDAISNKITAAEAFKEEN